MSTTTERTFTWDPDTGYIKDERGVIWGSADGPGRDEITRQESEDFGRAMAAGPELAAAVRGERLCHEQGCTRSTAVALGLLDGFLAHGSLWLRKHVAERFREALRKAGVQP